jgi:2-polyprenyl-3-methyl-5-hydroxy-6-metoxy-1,4-benzoquinol methylase
MTIELQQKFWNDWNATTRDGRLGSVSREQADFVTSRLTQLNLKDQRIIEIGCGAGWLSPQLAGYGKVVATDLAGKMVSRAAQRYPHIDFIAGDFMQLDFGRETFDVAVSLEVLSHVADQQAFITKIADLLRPGGYLLIGTQNRPALQQNDIPPPGPGQLRHWVDRHELHELLKAKFEVIELCSITPVFNRGWRRVLNSYKLNRIAEQVAHPLARWIKTSQEKAWLGWTLMALAYKRHG